MPVLTGRHNNSDIFLDVGILDANTIDIGDQSKLFSSIPTPAMFKALIDTGAQKTMISPNVINTLGLQPRGKILISGVGPTAHYHNAYLFHVAFITPIIPAGTVIQPGQQVTFQAYVNIQRDVIFGAEIPSTGGQFDVLLGMDILVTGMLVVQGGIYSFAY
jgi:hypothetical protein